MACGWMRRLQARAYSRLEKDQEAAIAAAEAVLLRPSCPLTLGLLFRVLACPVCSSRDARDAVLSNPALGSLAQAPGHERLQALLVLLPLLEPWSTDKHLEELLSLAITDFVPTFGTCPEFLACLYWYATELP